MVSIFWSCLCCTFALSASYKIPSPSYNPGFFSVFESVLGALDQYDQGHYKGLSVDFERDGLYYDKNYGNNWWGYFFENIQLGNTENALTFSIPQFLEVTRFVVLHMSRMRGYELIQRYIHVLPEIKNECNAFINEHFKPGHKILGVHYRGTDKYTEASTIRYDYVIMRIGATLKKLAPDSNFIIFVATDDAHFLTALCHHFGKTVVYQDALRSKNGVAIHWGTENNGYKKGKEALIDCLLLAKTDCIIKMASNLSDCSLFFNPHVPVVYLNTIFPFAFGRQAACKDGILPPFYNQSSTAKEYATVGALYSSRKR